MYIYAASNEYNTDLWWDNFDAVQLLMWYGIHLRAVGRMARRRAMGLYTSDIDPLIDDLRAEAGNIYWTLMHKCSLISDQEEFVTGVSDVMGEYFEYKECQDK